MRCYICDRVLGDEYVQYNEDHRDYDPCPTCLTAVEDLVAGYGDRPAMETEDDTDILLLEGLFPTTTDPFAGEY